MRYFLRAMAGIPFPWLGQSIFRLGGVFLTKHKVKDVTQQELGWMEDRETTATPPPDATCHRLAPKSSHQHVPLAKVDKWSY